MSHRFHRLHRLLKGHTEITEITESIKTTTRFVVKREKQHIINIKKICGICDICVTKKKKIMKAMTRQQIAYSAGVTVKTLGNWCKPYRKELEALGLRPGMIVLPPNIVRWICDKFCIDVEP